MPSDPVIPAAPRAAVPATICLLRLSALGDATHVVPLVRTLRRAWPGVALTWVIGKGEYRLLEGLEGVEFVVYDKKTGLAGMRALRGRFGGRRFRSEEHTSELQSLMRISYCPPLSLPAAFPLPPARRFPPRSACCACPRWAMPPTSCRWCARCDAPGPAWR